MTPLPTEVVPADLSEPKSLNSIFNAVNPISDEILRAQSPSAEEPILAHEPLIGSPTPTEDLSVATATQEQNPSNEGPKSLNSIFNVVNPIPDDILKASEMNVGTKPEPKSLNSVFNVVNPIPEELLGNSLKSELGDAHEVIAKPEVLPDGKPEPKSLNSIFNAVNPLSDFLEAQKKDEGEESSEG